MRFSVSIPFVRAALLLAVGTLPFALLHAQPAAAPAADAAPPATAEHDKSAAPGRANQRIERIHVEDSGAAVDELRVGGQTQSISVKPKGKMPEYEVLPKEGRRDSGADTGSNGTGPRVWNVLKF